MRSVINKCVATIINCGFFCVGDGAIVLVLRPADQHNLRGTVLVLRPVAQHIKGVNYV
jgi:hypothetical protein